MSFPHLDRCSCGSPTSSKDGKRTKKCLDVGFPQNKNDYKISPTKKRFATSNNLSNESSKISSARSQPSLRDENFKNSAVTRSAHINNPRLQKSKLEDANKKSPNDIHSREDKSKTENKNLSKTCDGSKAETTQKNKSTLFPSTESSRNLRKPSLLDELSNHEGVQTSAGETGSSSKRPQQNETETPSNSEYTPLSYDVNYVKVSPPRLTRRPKKADDNNTDNNNNNNNNNNSNSVLLSRAQQIGGARLTSEQKRTLKAPPQTPPDENKTEKNATEPPQEVLELTFTVLLEKGTLKKASKKREDTNSAMIKLKTDNIKLDSDSKRLVAESITEALRENTNFGNVSLVQVSDANNKTTSASKVRKSTPIEQGTNKEKLNYGILKSPVNDRNSLISKSFDCYDSKESKLQEVATSYQSLDRKHVTPRDRRQLDGIKEAGTSSVEEPMGKKYQALKTFSPLRLATSAIIHRGPINDSKKNRISNYHSRYDSDICDYETKERKTQRMLSKSFNNNNNNNNNNNKVWIKNKQHNNTSKDSNEEELTHMNWDDLMQEAKLLGIPLKRPHKMQSDTDRDFKFSQNNITSRFLKSFVGKKTGLKLTKSICGGEVGRPRDEYFNDLSYQCPYETKKSPLKDKFRFFDLILGRSKSSKTLNDDCPLCRQQQQQQNPLNFFNRGKNLIRRSMSTNRGINSKHKQLKCPKDHCYDYGCTCYCTCKNGPGIEAKTSRSNSSPPPMLLKQNFCRKAGCNTKCYDVCCKEFKNPKMAKTGGRMMFDTYSLSDNYRSLLSPKKSVGKPFPPESFCCQPYTPQIHHRHTFKLLHLNSCGDDGGFDDDNDVDDNKDDVFIDESDGLEFKNSKVHHPITKKEPSKSVGFDYPDGCSKNQATFHEKTSMSKVNQNNSTGFLRSLHLLKDKSWYWGNMTFERAEAILSNMADGSFLVRDSSDERFILSVSFRSQGRTHHTRIEHNQGVFSFYSQRSNLPSDLTSSIDTTCSSSIIDFIDDAVHRSLQGDNLYYLREVNDPAACPTPVRLLNPVSRLVREDGFVAGDVKA